MQRLCRYCDEPLARHLRNYCSDRCQRLDTLTNAQRQIDARRALVAAERVASLAHAHHRGA